MSGTSGAVVFDPVYFAARYPEFSTVSNLLLLSYFTEAGLSLNNTSASIVTDSSIGGLRYIWLHLLTAHIAALYSGVNGASPSQLVGRVSDATEGAVHVAADMGPQTASAAWFNQTKYGAQFWSQTARYRTAQYIAPQTCGGWGWGNGWGNRW